MSHFFSYLARMKFIRRWGLMRNTIHENIQEHTLQVAFIAHGLAVLRNTYYGGQVNAEKAALLGMYHDVGEIFTGDMPTPVKYFNKEMRDIYGGIEVEAKKKLLKTLPVEMRSIYEPLILDPENDELWAFVKAADTISAFIKCAEEKQAGNSEFDEAYLTIAAKVKGLDLPEAAHFMKEFVPSFSMSLDEMKEK